MIQLVKTDMGLQVRRGGVPADREVGRQDELAVLAQAIGNRVYAMQIKPVVTVEEAMEIVGKRSASALERWIREWAPRARCGKGRYSKEKILQGLRTEEARK